MQILISLPQYPAQYSLRSAFSHPTRTISFHKLSGDNAKDVNGWGKYMFYRYVTHYSSSRKNENTCIVLQLIFHKNARFPTCMFQ